MPPEVDAGPKLRTFGHAPAPYDFACERFADLHEWSTGNSREDYDPADWSHYDNERVAYARTCAAMMRPEVQAHNARIVRQALREHCRRETFAAVHRRRRGHAPANSRTAPRPRGAGRPARRSQRSCAKSGSSGPSEPPGEPEPRPVDQPAPRRTPWAFAYLPPTARGAEVDVEAVRP